MVPASLFVWMVVVIFTTVWVTMWFCRNHHENSLRWENEDFRQVIDRYEKMVATMAEEKRAAKILLDVVEALNLNTKSIATAEEALNQLILRSVGYQDRTKVKQTQVGEEATETKIANRTVLTPAPSTRTASGQDGFVDETTGKIVPLEKPTARELASTPPT